MLTTTIGSLSPTDPALPAALTALRRLPAARDELPEPIQALARNPELSAPALDVMLSLVEDRPGVRVPLIQRADLPERTRQTLISSLTEAEAGVLLDEATRALYDEDGTAVDGATMTISDHTLALVLVAHPRHGIRPFLHLLREADACRLLLRAWSEEHRDELAILLGSPVFPVEALPDVPVRDIASLTHRLQTELASLVLATCAQDSTRWEVLAANETGWAGTVADLLEVVAGVTEQPPAH